MLHGIDMREVMRAIRVIPPGRLLLAALFVAAGYFTLTLYDLFALRTIGQHHIPYRIAALAGFTSYSIGHNVGASVFTGAAVRYRIYSVWGLTAIDVAKICFVAGLTFWLGNATVLGVGVAFDPSAATAIDQLPVALNRAAACLILVLLTLYVAWVWRAPRSIGRSTWEVMLPGGPLTLLQIWIGIVDLGCCALAMFVLLPSAPHIAFVTLAVIFVSATLLGFASTSPGGLGVFDAAMFIGLWQFDRESLLAGLLLFRLLYYLLPFVIALAVLGVRELVLDVRELTPHHSVEKLGPQPFSGSPVSSPVRAPASPPPDCGERARPGLDPGARPGLDPGARPGLDPGPPAKRRRLRGNFGGPSL
jgi:uncharacterized membrane protein YbhN (UPF0104 family)